MTASTIRELIRRYQQQGNDPALRELARRCDALPVYSDMGGTLLLYPDGEVVAIDHDSEEPPKPASRGWRVTAYVRAAERYPELSGLVPEKEVGDQDCRTCSGKGWIEVGSQRLGCGKCWGLGWRPPDE